MQQSDSTSNVGLLAGDWQRHQQALAAALDQAGLLRLQLERAQLLSSDSVRDKLAVRLLQHASPEDPATAAEASADAGNRAHGRDVYRGPGSTAAAAGSYPVSAAESLLDMARLQHAEAHADELTLLASEVAALQVTATALDADEDQLRRRFLPKPKSLAAVIQDDERLAGLTEGEILAEVRAQAAEGVKRARLLRLRSRNASTHTGRNSSTPQPAGQPAAAAAGASGRGQRTAAVAQQRAAAAVVVAAAAVAGSSSDGDDAHPGEDSDAGDTELSSCYDEGDSNDDNNNDSDSYDDDDDGHSGVSRRPMSSHAVSGEASQSEVEPQLLPEDLPGVLHIIKQQRQCGRRNPVPLEAVAASLSASLPQQQEQLALLRRVAAYTSARLQAQAARLVTYAGELALTPQQRSIRGLAHSIIDELITSALSHVSMRPSQAVVDLELAEWRVGRPAALAAISRHVMDGLYKEVVDELLAEVTAEVITGAAAADTFSMDMLVAAVAFSTGKFDLGFTAAQAPHHRGVGGIAREAALLRKVASTKSTAVLTGADTTATATGAAGSSPAGLSFASHSSSSSNNINKNSLSAAPFLEASTASGGPLGSSRTSSVYLARRDFSALDNAFSGAGAALAATSAALGGPSRRLSTQGSVKYTRGLYLAGLRGMLSEMRGVRPAGTPAGHTQQLTPLLKPGQSRSKATRLAISRVRPPLAACAAVWEVRQGPLGRLEPGSWASTYHMAAAAKERAFWSKVTLRSYLLGPPAAAGPPTAPRPSALLVPAALGSISCLSACPSGPLVAVGTNSGALLVWDVSGRKADHQPGGDSDDEGAARPPMFQATGSGDVFKPGWWSSWSNVPQWPPITGLCWSADGFQLAALDADSNLKLWWMVPQEQQQQQQQQPTRGAPPPAPKLAVVVTPLNVTLSGKAPIADAEAAALLAAQESAAAAASGGGYGSSSSPGRTGLLPKLGQWLGLSSAPTQGSNGVAVGGGGGAGVAAAGAGAGSSLGSGGVDAASSSSSSSRQVPSHQWHPVFHPSRTPAGTQPTLVIPQVTGDVLSVTTAIAEAAVQPGPAPTAQQGAVGAALAAAVTGEPAVAAAAGGSTATGKGQRPAGAAYAAGQAAASKPAAAAAAAAAATNADADNISSSAGKTMSAVSSTARALSRRSSSVGGGGSSGCGWSSLLRQGRGADGLLPQAVVDYLMPPRLISPDVDAQALYRCHSAPVVFLGFLSDDTSLISLDTSGLLVLWPQHATQCCGFGWLKPRARWQLPRMMRTCQLRGGLLPLYPAARTTQLGATPAAASSSSRAGSSSSRAGSSSSTWYVRYVPDAQDQADEQLLQQDPPGDFLLSTRTPWLVRYLPGSSTAAAGRPLSSSGSVVRQVFHRPADATAPGSNVAVVSSYDAATGALLMRAKQRCTFTKAPVKVVGAKLTPSKRELLVLCRTAPQADDASSLSTLTATTINLATMKAAVPRIDLPDITTSAAGPCSSCPPAFEVSPPLVTTGSEYLLGDLGCGVVGLFSLATGQLVREVRLHSMQAPTSAAAAAGAGVVLCSLQWLQLSGAGVSSSTAGNTVAAAAAATRRTLLAAACVGGQHVALVDLDLEGAAQQARAEQEQLAVARQQMQQRQRQQQGGLGMLQADPTALQAPLRWQPSQQQQQQQQVLRQQQPQLDRQQQGITVNPDKQHQHQGLAAPAAVHKQLQRGQQSQQQQLGPARRSSVRFREPQAELDTG